MAGNDGARRGSRWRIALWGAAALILLTPLVAMQFTDSVQWGVLDFVFAGALLFGTGITYELAVRVTRNTAYRAGVGVALTAAFLLVWVNAAVGILGDEDSAANLMIGVVLAIGILGVINARFQPRGMSRAMFAAAVAQALVGVIALTRRLGANEPTWPRDVLGMTGFFVTLLVASALLFRNAAEEKATVAAAPPGSGG